MTASTRIKSNRSPHLGQRRCILCGSGRIVRLGALIVPDATEPGGERWITYQLCGRHPAGERTAQMAERVLQRLGCV